MVRGTLTLALVLVLAASAAVAQDEPQTVDEENGEGKTPAELVDMAKALKPSLASVEVWLQYDKGEEPPYSDHVAEERPFEASAYVLAPDKVYTQDMAIHPRFIKSVSVRFGDQVVPARPWAYMLEQDAVILALEKPLAGVKPLEFKADAEGPYMMAPYYKRFGVWTTSMESISPSIGTNEQGQAYTTCRSYALVTDETGSPVALCYNRVLPVDGSWRGSPLKQPMMPAADRDQKVADIEKACEQTLCRVTLNFRSPKKREQTAIRRTEDDQATELNVVGVVTGRKTVIVLANLKPNVTARLEKIKVHRPEGDPLTAKFQITLADYGCFLATLDTEAEQVAELSPADVLGAYKRLLLTADVRVQGEQRIAYYCHRRIHSFDESWEGKIYPEVGGSRGLFFFDTDGELVVLPVERREKGAGRSYYRGSGSMVPLPAAYLKDILDKLEGDNIDPSNVPVSEEEESRLAWMGVVLQPLNRELARANNVSDLTHDGQTGALVAYVYPDSPAGKAGVEAGWVLLRLHVEGEPKPMDVQVEESPFATRPFPWVQWDELPEEYYDRFPVPWLPAENTFTRALTDFGFGKKYKADFFTDGKVVPKDFEIVQSPPHYDSAPKYKSEPLGMTVRDMTYEVRRYFQKTPEDPGVIIAQEEPGSKASVAGVKPYEIITHVDDQPVKSVKDFETLTTGKQELRLSVLRMTRGRQVKIKLDAPGAGGEPEKADGDKPEAGGEAPPAGGDKPEAGAGEGAAQPAE